MFLQVPVLYGYCLSLFHTPVEKREEIILGSVDRSYSNRESPQRLYQRFQAEAPGPSTSPIVVVLGVGRSTRGSVDILPRKRGHGLT